MVCQNVMMFDFAILMIDILEVKSTTIFCCRRCLPRLLQQSARPHFSIFQHLPLSANGVVCQKAMLRFSKRKIVNKVIVAQSDLCMLALS